MLYSKKNLNGSGKITMNPFFSVEFYKFSRLFYSCSKNSQIHKVGRSFQHIKFLKKHSNANNAWKLRIFNISRINKLFHCELDEHISCRWQQGNLRKKLLKKAKNVWCSWLVSVVKLNSDVWRECRRITGKTQLFSHVSMIVFTLFLQFTHISHFLLFQM